MCEGHERPMRGPMRAARSAGKDTLWRAGRGWRACASNTTIPHMKPCGPRARSASSSCSFDFLLEEAEVPGPMLRRHRCDVVRSSGLRLTGPLASCPLLAQRETRWTQEVLSTLQSLQDKLRVEIEAATPPEREEVSGAFEYFTAPSRVPGDLPAILRRPRDVKKAAGRDAGADSPRIPGREVTGTERAEAEVVVDLGATAERLRAGSLRLLGLRVSPDQTKAAILVAPDGDERPTLILRHLHPCVPGIGEGDREKAAEVLVATDGRGVSSVEWDAHGEAIYGTVLDTKLRACEVWRWRATKPSARTSSFPSSSQPNTLSLDPPEILLRESDEHFFLDLSLTKDGRFLVINSNSKVGSAPASSKCCAFGIRSVLVLALLAIPLASTLLCSFA